tara:strand:+ start:209 stop:688 length:480 start_codon:yes stop_codon:yes gene_type:complete
MKMIDGIPEIIEGIAYYAHVDTPVADYNESMNPGTGKFGWEVNVAVSDEVFLQFKQAGFNAGLHEAGSRKYTPDPVITFYKWASNFNGTANMAPIVVDTDKQRVDYKIGNGSRIAIQWAALSYGKVKKIKRPSMNAVQILDLVEQGESQQTFTEDRMAF